MDLYEATLSSYICRYSLISLECIDLYHQDVPLHRPIVLPNVELSLVTFKSIGNGMNAKRPKKMGTIAQMLLRPKI
jgi:hypothetical protein